MRRALLLALPLAGLGVWLWTSAQLPGDTAQVPAASVFTRAQIDTAQDYRTAGYAITLAALAAQVLVAWLVAWRTRGRLGRFPAVITLAASAAVVQLAALPFGYALHRRAVEAGLDLQSDGAWLLDALVAAAVTTLAVTVVYLLARPLYRRWGSVAVALAAWLAVALFTLVQPIVVDPLFTSTSPLPAGAARTVAGLERRMHVHPASVTVADASTRTTAENAEVDGLGPTVRVVVDDTALHEPAPAFRALIAHELAHVQRSHTLEGVLWFGVIGVPAILLVLAAARRLHRGSLLGAEAAPTLVACAVTAAVLLVPVQNLVSRRIESEADWVALRTTRDPAGMELLQRRLALRDLSNPAPPRWAVWLLFDHPPVMQRIAVARAYGSSSSSSSSSSP
ncbi:MAG TPA: M48 family metalloprotease [Gaiellales bacterium]|nr:M48 family metalloprotease [Gaiellales bacterium]